MLAQMEMDMIAEGYYAFNSVHKRNKEYKVDLPIIDSDYNVVYNKIPPVVEMRILADNLD